MLMVEGRFDPDRLIAAVTGEMTGEDFACYMMISTLIFSRGKAVPDEPTRDKLKSIFGMHGRRVNTALERLVALGKVTIENETLMTECCREQLQRLERPARVVAAQAAPPVLPPLPPVAAAPPPAPKTNGTKPHAVPAIVPPAPALGLFGAGDLPVHETRNGTVETARIREQEFRIWYEDYPNKKAPVAALRAFIKARQVASVEELTKARDRYAREVAGRERSLIAHPATWLNQGRYRDDPDQQPDSGHGRAWA